jgi:hypothetical protein
MHTEETNRYCPRWAGKGLISLPVAELETSIFALPLLPKSDMLVM